MTIIIYFDESKKNFQIIKPKTWAKEAKDNFDGNVRKLVEHVTCSDHKEGRMNYYKFDIL